MSLNDGLRAALRAVPVSLPSDFEDRGGEFLSLLSIWNRKMNLVSRKLTLDDLAGHLVSSLAPLELFQRQGTRFLDVGSGGGFPGVILAMARPDWTGVLVEATRKKCLFLREAVETLAPGRLEVENLRFEELEPEAGAFDLITLRAVRVDRALARHLADQLAPGGSALVFAPQDSAGREELRDHLANAGLETGEFRPVDWAGVTLLAGTRGA